MKTKLIFGGLLALSGFVNSQNWIPVNGNLINNPQTSWVGVGTMNPQTKFQVVDGNLAHVNIFSMSSNAAKLSLSNSFFTYYMTSDLGIGHLGMQTSNGDYDILNFQKSGTFFTPQVWIGSLRPQGVHADFNFAVEGKIVAQSVYVTANTMSNWADYVFAEDYKLPSLKEVEKFYKENKHLPEIPTAKEVAEKGIDVGEMNTLLLKKVEELTLYVVDLNKKVEKLQGENTKLKATNNQ